ncbi:hypothetical protein GN956_G5222 [Arapaima gigas]
MCKCSKLGPLVMRTAVWQHQDRSGPAVNAGQSLKVSYGGGTSSWFTGPWHCSLDGPPQSSHWSSKALAAKQPAHCTETQSTMETLGSAASIRGSRMLVTE